MSYTTMYAVPEKGEVYEVAEFKNAFRSAFMVWDQLSERYLGNGVALKMMSPEKMQEVWAIAKQQYVPISHRIVMLITFDNVMVKRENFGRVIEAVETYARDFDPGSLLGQANKMRELENDESIYAVCWNQTSVVEPFWHIEGGNNKTRMYDLSRDMGHWFLFDKLGDKED